MFKVATVYTFILYDTHSIQDSMISMFTKKLTWQQAIYYEAT